ncbi:hypothetical protein FBU31_002666 [Coemansia sp. 'formosensis']|nr:hypothetical protein FBU31_002666 [Coemansia sp. 'formosensis']KAJ2832394.1 hypothetical protein GGI24_001248 [Coemansia furcata]
MPVTSISNLDELRKLIKTNDRVIVKFGGGTCRNCHIMDSIYLKLSDENTNIMFLSVDIDTSEDIKQKYGIDSSPTFKFYEHSVEAGQVTGAIVCALNKGIKMLSAV